MRMKMLLKGALIGACLLSATPPAMAAELQSTGEQRMGAFGGLRVRLPLGGEARERQLRAGLALAPAMHSWGIDGESRLRVGEGVEFGLRGHEPMRFSVAGQDVRRLAAREGDGDGGGIPTGALIAGGIILAAVVSVALVADAFSTGSD